MKRLHLFEFNDQAWLPKVIRKGLTDILRFHAGQIYTAALSQIESILLQTKHKKIIDLGSGSGGPWPILFKELDSTVELILSDKFPQQAAINLFDEEVRQRVSYEATSEDILNTDLNKEALYTLFTGLHHLRPQDIQAWASKIEEQQGTVAFYEFTERKWINLLLMPFSSLMIFLISPFIPGIKWPQLLFTYLIPLIPLAYLWDGCVSHLRSYSKPELESLLKGAAKPVNYHWEVKQVKHGRLTITSVLGYAFFQQA